MSGKVISVPCPEVSNGKRIIAAIKTQVTKIWKGWLRYNREADQIHREIRKLKDEAILKNAKDGIYFRL